MAGKFAVYEDKAGRYRFRVKAGNGQVVARGRADRSASTNRQATMKGRAKVSGDAPPSEGLSS